MSVVYDKILGKLRMGDVSSGDGGGGTGSNALVACSDLGIELGVGQIDIAFDDPPDLMDDDVLVGRWQRTVAVMKPGYYPTGPMDGTIIAATSRDGANEDFALPQGVSYGTRGAYAMSPVTVPVADSGTIRVKLFSCTTDGVWNALSGNEFPTSTSYSWGQLAAYADAGTFLSRIPVGSTLSMEHSDFTDEEWLVVGADCFEPTNSSGGHHIGLLSKRVLFSECVDAVEDAWAVTEDTAAVRGVVYGLMVNSEIVTLTESTDWSDGDTSVTYNGVSYPIATWYEKNPLNQADRGSNFLPQRNDVQWMCSDGDANGWFQKQNIWDKCRSGLAARAGFLKGLPSAFRRGMLTCGRTAAVHSNYQIRGRGSSVQFNAVAFPLSAYETTGDAVGGVNEGKGRLAVFSSQSDLIAYKGTSVGQWWLGSYGNGAGASEYITDSGSVGTTYVNNPNTRGYRPACALGKPVVS